MGSVISYEECPRCGTEDGMFEDFYYKTGEIYCFCQHCGYTDNHTLKREDGKFIKDKDEYIWLNEHKEPWGAYAIFGESGVGTLGVFEEKPNIDNLIKDMFDKPEEVKSFTISWWDGKKLNKKQLIEQ